MDPPALINGGTFAWASAGAVPYNLTEIWQFQLNGSEPAGGALGLGGPPFRQGNGTSNFPSRSGIDHEAGGDCPASLEPRVSLGYGGGGGKRREPEDDSAKAGASTRNGDGLNDCDGKRLENRRDETPGDISKSAEAAAKPRPLEPPSLGHWSKTTSTSEPEVGKPLIAPV